MCRIRLHSQATTAGLFSDSLKRPFSMIKYLQHIFLTWVWPPPPPLNDIKKDALLAKDGFPYHKYYHRLQWPVKELWVWREGSDVGPRKDEGAALEIAIVTEEPFWRQIREEVREVQKKSLFCSMETFQLQFLKSGFSFSFHFQICWWELSPLQRWCSWSRGLSSMWPPPLR